MKDITTEEAIILLNDFKNGEIRKDKLENDARGGFKLGYFYTKDIQQAIEKVLNELETYKHYYEELTTGQVTSAQLLKKYVSKDELEKYKELYVRTLGHTLNNSIAQSDKLKDDLEALNEGWKIELEKKDKIIDAMALQLSGISIWDDQKEEPLILMTEEEVKQYFENEVKDE